MEKEEREQDGEGEGEGGDKQRKREKDTPSHNSIHSLGLYLSREHLLNIITNMYIQASTITIKSPYVITYACQHFGVRDARGQIPKSVYQAAYLSSSDFLNNFYEARFYLNRMKDR